MVEKKRCGVLQQLFRVGASWRQFSAAAYADMLGTAGTPAASAPSTRTLWKSLCGASDGLSAVYPTAWRRPSEPAPGRTRDPRHPSFYRGA